MVRHREGDFDFRRHLSHIFPCVTNVHFGTVACVQSDAIPILQRLRLGGRRDGWRRWVRRLGLPR